MLFIRLLLTTLLLFNFQTTDNNTRTLFISPLKIPLLLSANFGELRPDHIHSGIDIKTQGVSGQEVVAAEDGYVYRISITPGGFGNALYISHPSGYSTVYGHLSSFAPEIAKYVRSEQYANKSFQLTLFLPSDKFPVKQGEVVAYSGNSGSSGGPHLHFEIRRSSNEKPLNPLLFNFNIKDNIPPVIEKLAVYPASKHTVINGGTRMVKMNVRGGDGKYNLSSEDNITINGMAGFGIKTYDLLNDSRNRCAIYSIELKIDTNTIYKYEMDGFAFSETRYVNSHIDYETYLKENQTIQRTFVLPNDKLTAYKELKNRGLFYFHDVKIHHVQIIISDVYNNRSFLDFNVRSDSSQVQTEPENENKGLQMMPYNRVNRFISDNIYVAIPANALYDTLYFSYKMTPGSKGMLSDLHSVHNKYTPLQKKYTLSIKPTIIPSGKESKMLIIQLLNDHLMSAVTSKWSGEYITGEVYNFGDYFIGIDTIPPEISPLGFTRGADLSAKNEIRIRITDELSGIKSYEAEIDGKWALFEYDQKSDLLTYFFDESRIAKGTKHNLALKLTDNKDNSSYFNCDFTW
jgi:hypothetical protein